MGIYAGGVEYSKAYVGGVEFTGALAGGESYLAAAPTGLLGYPPDFWAEYRRSDVGAAFSALSSGAAVWLFTSDGEPLEQEFKGGSQPDTWRAVTADTDEPDPVTSVTISGFSFRFRKAGLPWLPSDDGLSVDDINWQATGVYRFFPPDQPGTITHGVTRRQGGGIDIAAVISDPDGIATVDSAQLDATDGRTNDISADWVRRDANSFTHADDRTGNRWRKASMSITYTGGNGVQSTLTDSWDV